MITIERLDSHFGAEARGVRIDRGVDDDTMRALTEALYVHRVLVIRDQSLSEDQYLAFGRQWGEPIAHVLDHMRMPGYPEMMTVGNTEKRDEDDKIRNGAALWHTDQSYEREPATATMLYSIVAPREGGETQFCDMAAAWKDLEPTLRERVAGLEIAHKYGLGRRRPDEPPANPIANDEQDARVPPVYHPLVMPHPVTERPALYALGHGAHGVRGWNDAEALDLIDELKRHALDERHIYRHRYEVGDVVVWDTMQTMHCATPIGVASDARDSRLLWRISVRGRPQIYQ